MFEQLIRDAHAYVQKERRKKGLPRYKFERRPPKADAQVLGVLRSLPRRVVSVEERDELSQYNDVQLWQSSSTETNRKYRRVKDGAESRS